LGLFTVLLGAALPMIDFFIVNVALPSIERDLHASPATLEMVVEPSARYQSLFILVPVLPGNRVGTRASWPHEHRSADAARPYPPQ
ncbi:hypothetical protein E2651_36360, partial [Streptomyces sp. MZ04]